MIEEFKDIKCNFNLYRSFYAVAITGSFSDAARLLYVSQPSLSYNVKQLEEQLNINLFYRKNNGVSLTYEGENLLEHIKKAFNTIIEAEAFLLESTNNKNGSLIIGAPTHVMSFYVIPLIEKFVKEYPDIHLKIVEKNTTSLKELLQKGEIDIMIDTFFTISDTVNFENKIISNEKCCFAAVKEIMSKCKEASDLNSFSLILPSVGGNLRKITDEYFNYSNIKVIPKIETFTTETTILLVEKGLGIGFFYEKSIEKLLKKEKLVKFDDHNKIPTISLCCAYSKKSQNEILDSFLKNIE